MDDPDARGRPSPPPVRVARAPIALCLEVAEPAEWDRAGGLRRLLDLLGPAPVLVLAAVSARPEETSLAALAGGDGRVEQMAGPGWGPGARETQALASAGQSVAALVRALARSDRTAFELALGDMGYEAVRVSPSRALRRVEPGQARDLVEHDAEAG